MNFSLSTPMNNYESLRRVWAFELEHRGEVRRLAPAERDLLRCGSLEVLCTSRVARLDRRIVALTVAAAASALVLGFALASLLVGRSALLWDMSLADAVPGSAPMLLALALVALAGVSVCAGLRRRLVRRRAIYRSMGAATTHVLAAR